MSQIFVSYKSQDGERVRDLVEALQSQGWDVWWDRRLEGGAEWRKQIEARLAAATVVIVVWTERSATGADNIWVLSEATAARKRHVLIPVMLDPVEPPKPFDQIQTIDLTSWTPGERSEEFDRLLTDVGNRLESPPDFEKRPRRRFPVAYLAAGAGAILTAALLAFIARSGNLDTGALTLLASLAALAGGVTAFGMLWELARYRLRSLKLPLTLAASIIAGLATTFAGYLLGTAGSEVTLKVRDAAGECPAELAGKRLLVTSSGRSDPRSATIGASCIATFTASRDELRGSAIVDLEANEGYFVSADARTRTRSLAGSPIELTVTPVASTPRAQLSLLEYLGTRDSPERSARFEEFRGILQDKMETLAEQLRTNPDLPPNVARTRQLDRMKVDSTGDPSDLSSEEKLAYWRQTHSLGVLTGTVTQDEGFEVASRVFIGDLAGMQGRRSFPLSMRLSAEEFGRARDTHAAALLYALALDGKRLGFSQDVVVNYLSEAFEIVQNLEATGTSEEVAALKREIDRALGALAGGGGT